MRRPVILALSVALIVLVFAPIANAQANYQGGGNQGGMGSGGTDDMGMDDNMTASSASSASTTATPSASASASPSASQAASASASASAPGATSSASAAPSNELPDTGGIPLASLLSVGAVVFVASSGIFAARLMRRIS